MMGRYQGNFGGLGVYGILGYSGSGHVHVWGSVPGGGSAVQPTVAYNGFNVGDGGLALTYAGFTVGGNVLWGAFNGQVQLEAAGRRQCRRLGRWCAIRHRAVDVRCVLHQLPAAGRGHG